ncbi:MAG: 2-polyprenylphenol 6-hydroxylase [Magnetococcales bacterium]|nr:2-polyprenylphenol 6-hydroxylase [Magnetococcales bacterium]
MLGTFRTLRRLASIVGILIRYDIEPVSERFFPYRLLTWLAGLRPAVRRLRHNHSPAARLRLALEALGPTFVKFGQALSTRVDALPEDVGREMKKLQDAVAPFPFEEVRRIVERGLGRTLEQAFSSFDPKPVASASIAQVHHALTREGREVAVKVKRPDIDAVVLSDIRTLTFLADLIEEYLPDWRRFKAHKVVEEFAGTIRNEMNFQLEGSRAQEFRANFRNDPELHVPEVIWPLSSQNVLTLEWVTGIPIDELARHPELLPAATSVSRNMVAVFFKQVFRDGYFHADQHPGNLLVRKDGTLVTIDFGIIGRVNMQTRLWLADMLRGFLDRDYERVAQVHLDAGYIPPHTDLAEFQEACRQIGEPIFGQPLKEISIAKLLSQLFKTTERFDMEVQPQLLLLQKTILTLEGVGREINPNLNVWMLAEPLIREWMVEHLGPKGKLRAAGRGVGDVAHATGLVPDLLRRGVVRLTRDDFRPRLHPESLVPLERRLQAGFRSQAAAFTGGSLMISAAILASSGFSLWLVGPLVGLAGLQFFKGAREERRRS